MVIFTVFLMSDATHRGVELHKRVIQVQTPEAIHKIRNTFFLSNLYFNLYLQMSNWKFTSVSQLSENISFEFSHFSLLSWIPCRGMQQAILAKDRLGRSKPNKSSKKLISVRAIELKHSENYTVLEKWNN